MNFVAVMREFVKIDLKTYLRLPLSSFYLLLAYLELEFEKVLKSGDKIRKAYH